VRKLRSQYSRATSLESAPDLMRRCLGRRLPKPVDVIRLDSPIQNGPAGFRCDRNANFTQTIRNRTHKHLLGPFRDPHPRVIHRIHRRVSTSELFSFHVDSVSGIDRTSQGNLRVRTPFGIITSAKAQGFPAPESYNRLSGSHEAVSSDRLMFW
jgi:hypothetical protein